MGGCGGGGGLRPRPAHQGHGPLPGADLRGDPRAPPLRERRFAARAGLVLLALVLGALVALNAGFGFEGTLTPLKGYAFVSPAFQSLAAVPVVRDVPLPLPYAYVQGLDMVSRDSRAAGLDLSPRALQPDGIPFLFFLGLPGQGADRHPAPPRAGRRALGLRPAAGPWRRGIPDRAGDLHARLFQPVLPARHRRALHPADLPLPLRFRQPHRGRVPCRRGRSGGRLSPCSSSSGWGSPRRRSIPTISPISTRSPAAPPMAGAG